MLEGLRAIQNTWVGKSILAIVMAFIVVSFAIWGIGDIFRGIGGNQVAKVGTVEVTAQAYRAAYRTELETLQQRARRPITNEEAHAEGVDSMVLSRMLTDATLDDQAQALGLSISNAEIAKSILTDPAFAGPGGAFDRNRFNAVLRNEGFNEQSFVREQRHVYLRQEIILALAGDLAVPKAALEALHRYGAETRSLDYVLLTPAMVEPIPAPDEAALKTYYDAHTQVFSAPQYRKLMVLSISPSALAKPADVSDADAKALYDKTKDARYTTPEHRTVQQIVFPNDEDAGAAAARIKSGTSFADLVTERKLDAKDVDLGSVTHDQIYDKSVADAAFALPQDGTSDPVKGAFGPVLIHVASIVPAGVQPFDEVSAAIKREIATGRADVSVKTLHDKIEDARSAGKPLAEAAQSVGLEARTIEAVDAQGLDKGGKSIEGLTDEDAVIKAAFASDVGVDNDTISGRDGGTTWFEVAGIEAARPRPLDEVRAQVEAAWRQQDSAKRLLDKATELVKSLQDGQSVDDIAKANGNLAVSHANDVKRTGAPGLPEGVGPQAFDGPVGSAGSAPQPDGSRAVFKVLDSIVPPLDPDAADTKSLEDRYGSGLSQDVLLAYLSKYGAKVGMKVNPDAMRNAAGAAF